MSCQGETTDPFCSMKTRCSVFRCELREAADFREIITKGVGSTDEARRVLYMKRGEKQLIAEKGIEDRKGY